MTNTASSNSSPKLHVADGILIALGVIALILYGVALGVHAAYYGIESVSWGAALTFVFVGAVLMIGGFIAIRYSESHRGSYALLEIVGVVAFGLGSVLLFLGAMPDMVIDEIQKQARAFKVLEVEPPLVSSNQDSDTRTLNISRIGLKDANGNLIDPDKTKVYVLIIQDPTDSGGNLTTSVDVPTDATGKVWFKVEGNVHRESKAQDF